MDFRKKPSVQELWHHLLTAITAAQSMALFLTVQAFLVAARPAVH